MIGCTEASTFSTESVALYRFSSVGSIICSQKSMPYSMIRVTLVVQTVELGEASPKDAFKKPAVKPYVFDKKPPTRGWPLPL